MQNNSPSSFEPYTPKYTQDSPEIQAIIKELVKELNSLSYGTLTATFKNHDNRLKRVIWGRERSQEIEKH